MSSVDVPAELESRLLRCFSSVFPALTDEEIRTTSVDDQGVWDSLATVTLAAVVEQEFDLQIDSRRMPELTSFAAFLNYLREPTGRQT